jgi:hypothetical protein
MAGTTNNSPTPPPLDETAMLAWIEGRLSRIEESDLVKRSRPGTADRVAQMQANRRTLQSVREERAPAELMDRVLAALEREALIGLSNGQDLFEHPPISIATATKAKSKPGWAQRNAPALALAAGVALLVAGGIYWSSLLFKPSKPVEVASNREPKPATVPITPDRPAGWDVEPGATGLAAHMDGDELEAHRRELDKQTKVLADADLAADVPEAAPAAPAAPALTPGRMLALAREGRLAMRVSARDLTKLAQIEEPPKFDRPWRLSKDVPLTVVAAITPKAGTPALGADAPPVIAAATPAAVAKPLIGPGAGLKWAFEAAADPASRVRATYIIDLPNTVKDLDHIKLVFKDRLHAEVAFEELEGPVPMARVEDPETLLWWTLPPAQWVERVTVPVVVEAR